MSNTGSIVSVTNQVALEDLSDELVTTIAYTRAYADEMRGTLGIAIENLNSIVGTYNPEIEVDDQEIPTVDRPSFPTRPSFLPLELDNNWPSTYVPDPAFQEYGLLDFDFVAPTAPSELTGNFNYIAKGYTSEMWQAIFTDVHGKIINGAYGVTDAVHYAMVAQEQEARRRNQDRAFREGLAAVGAMGFNFPGGHQAAFMSEFGAEVLANDQIALNNITIKCFEIANDNQKFYTTTALELEKLIRATFDEAEKISLEAAKATSEYLARFYAENVKLYLGKWEGIKIKMESLKAKIEAISSRNESETKIFISRAQVIESQIKAITEKNKGLVDARTGEIQVYATEVGAVRDEYMALVEEIRVHQAAIKMEIDRSVAVEQLKLSAFESKVKLAEAIAMGIANIGSQGVASALGAINTNLSNSYGATESRGIAWHATLTESNSTSNDTNTSTSDTTSDNTTHTYVHKVDE